MHANKRIEIEIEFDKNDIKFVNCYNRYMICHKIICSCFKTVKCLYCKKVRPLSLSHVYNV